MLNVCSACGIYSEEKVVRPGEGLRAWAACPVCRHEERFLRMPLFLVTGASGAGKTALALHMAQTDRHFVHLESDILWRAEFNDPANDYAAYRALWLRLCMNIAQAGKPVVLYGSVTPGQMEDLPARKFIGPLHYLALVCAPDVLAARLLARPSWRQAGGSAFLQTMQAYNAWFLEHGAQASAPLTLLDTSNAALEESASAVGRWLAQRWDSGMMETI